MGDENVPWTTMLDVRQTRGEKSWCSIANSTRETLAVFTLLITSGKCLFSYLRHQMQLTQVGSMAHAELTVVRMCVGHSGADQVPLNVPGPLRLSWWKNTIVR